MNSTLMGGVEVEPEPEQPTPELPPFTADPAAEELHLELQDRQRFSVMCTSPDPDAQLELAWRAMSFETGGTVSDRSTAEDDVIHEAWELKFVTTGLHRVEVICYDRMSGWMEEESWVVQVEAEVGRGVV